MNGYERMSPEERYAAAVRDAEIYAEHGEDPELIAFHREAAKAWSERTSADEAPK